MSGKRPYRWDHLNDFRHDGSGSYVYGGKTYVYNGSLEDRAAYLRLVAALAAAAVLFAALPECLPPVAMSRSFITLLPWLAQCICVFILAWRSVRLLFRAGELREYIYKATVPHIPRLAVAVSAASFLTLAAQTAFMIIYGMNDPAALTLARPLCSLANGVAPLILRVFIVKHEWIPK